MGLITVMRVHTQQRNHLTAQWLVKYNGPRVHPILGGSSLRLGPRMVQHTQRNAAVKLPQIIRESAGEN